MIEKNKRIQELKLKRKPAIPSPKIEKTKRERIESKLKKHKNNFNYF